jgi:SAM-dependent methyltransferase
MHVDPLKNQWETYNARRDYWRAKNKYYHRYLEKLINYHVPASRSLLRLQDPYSVLPESGSYDYVVISDLLGYVYDIEALLAGVKKILAPRGRILITQYNTLWEPVLRFGSLIGIRAPSVEQSWISRTDLSNFLTLEGFEVIQNGTKLIFPKYVPLISAFLNTIVANMWPFSRLGLIHYAVARPLPKNVHHNPSISIVVPARNEAGTIRHIIDQIPNLGVFTELIFIEGNSTDNTREVIEKEVTAYSGPKKLLWDVQDGKGKGDAVRKGFAKATGDILAIYDADMTVPPEDMDKFYTAIVSGRGDFINGSRLVYPVGKGAMRIANMVGNKFFSLAFSWILGQPLKDTLCGTKVLWKEDYDAIVANRHFFGDFDPFGDFDLLFGAAKLHLKIIDLPIRYRDRVYGATNISRWKHGVLLLRMTLFAAKKLVFW